MRQEMQRHTGDSLMKCCRSWQKRTSVLAFCELRYGEFCHVIVEVVRSSGMELGVMAKSLIARCYTYHKYKSCKQTRQGKWAHHQYLSIRVLRKCFPPSHGSSVVIIWTIERPFLLGVHPDLSSQLSGCIGSWYTTNRLFLLLVLHLQHIHQGRPNLLESFGVVWYWCAGSGRLVPIGTTDYHRLYSKRVDVLQDVSITISFVENSDLEYRSNKWGLTWNEEESSNKNVGGSIIDHFIKAPITQPPNLLNNWKWEVNLIILNEII